MTDLIKPESPLEKAEHKPAGRAAGRWTVELVCPQCSDTDEVTIDLSNPIPPTDEFAHVIDAMTQDVVDACARVCLARAAGSDEHQAQTEANKCAAAIRLGWRVYLANADGSCGRCNGTRTVMAPGCCGKGNVNGCCGEPEPTPTPCEVCSPARPAGVERRETTLAGISITTGMSLQEFCADVSDTKVLEWYADFVASGATEQAETLKGELLRRMSPAPAPEVGGDDAATWLAAAEHLWPADKPKPDEAEWFGNIDDFARDRIDEHDYALAQEFRERAALARRPTREAEPKLSADTLAVMDAERLNLADDLEEIFEGFPGREQLEIPRGLVKLAFDFLRFAPEGR